MAKAPLYKKLNYTYIIQTHSTLSPYAKKTNVCHGQTFVQAMQWPKTSKYAPYNMDTQLC